MKKPHTTLYFLELLALVAIASTTLSLTSLEPVRSEVLLCANSTDCDDNNPCTNDTCETCDLCVVNCTVGCMHMPLNATGCNLDNGESCSVGGQCTSTFCADGVCCNTACDLDVQVCDVPGSVGTCTDIAPAPAVTYRGMLIVGILLIGIGIFGIKRTLRLQGR